jgi:hypothetical protein
MHVRKKTRTDKAIEESDREKKKRRGSGRRINWQCVTKHKKKEESRRREERTAESASDVAVDVW